MNTIQLCCGKEGLNYSIVQVSGKIRNRLSELGFTKDTVVKIVRHSCNKGPLEILIRGFLIALRHEEAELITVKPVIK